jgi:hypothetical protein
MMMELAAVCMRPRTVAEVVVPYAEAWSADLVQCVESVPGVRGTG